MSKLQKIAAAVLLVLLLAALYGLWATNQSTAPVRALKAQTPAAAASAMPVIDQNTLLTAQRLARLATTPEEQPLAQQAVETADHELDLAFAAMLRHLEAHPPPLSPEASQIQDRLNEAQKVLASDQENVKKLTAQLAAASDAEKAAIQDRLELAQSQVDLEQDEVQEANYDLLQAGGNVHQRIQMMQQQHEAAQRNATATTAVSATAAASGLAALKGMVGDVRQWLALHDKQRWLAEAQQQASASAAQLSVERQQIAAELAASKARIPEFATHAQHAIARAAAAAAPASAAPAPAGSPVKAPSAPASPAPAQARAPAAAATQRTTSQPPATAAQPATATPTASPPVAAGAAAQPTTMLELTRRIAAEQRRLTLRDQRISARQKLADIYGQWRAIVASQARTVLHACLAGAAIVLVVLLLLLFADRWLERLLARAPIDRRQLATLRSVIGVTLQLIGVVVILLALVGLPGQLGTMLGIIGAGLTVALKDFIVAFIGWFVLMGRNGIRIGDWVEINGVSGEVV